MIRIVSPALLGGTLLLLAACNHSSPVAENAGAPPPDMIGDASSSGLGAPANSAAAEGHRKVAQPVPTDGMSWLWDAAHTTARFGPSATTTAFSIACDPDHDQLIFHRFDAAPVGGMGTMSFTGNGRVASLPAATIGDQANQSSSWQAAAPPSDLTSAVARVFDGAGPVEIALSGTVRLVTAASPITQQPFAVCHR